MEERFYYLGFSAFSGIGPVKFSKLISRFGSARSAWEARENDLSEILGKNLAERFDQHRLGFSILNYTTALRKRQIDFLTLVDSSYPAVLKRVKDSPFTLYVRYSQKIYNKKDNPFNLNNFFPAIAVVGTRRITDYGSQVTELFVTELTDAGFTIVSGLALGVDAKAHMSALKNNAKTIAVLGSGCDLCYPVENQSLYNSIIESSGCVVSQFPLGQKPTKGSFPRRNAVIAGLSQAVLVTEGAKDSGSLITADYAFKNKRTVFAVPGPITSVLSKGPYKLIEKGAKLVTKTDDILKEFKLNPPGGGQNLKTKGETEQERRILILLENDSLYFDEIIKKTNFSSAELAGILSMMEIKGIIKSLESGMFAKVFS